MQGAGHFVLHGEVICSPEFLTHLLSLAMAMLESRLAQGDLLLGGGKGKKLVTCLSLSKKIPFIFSLNVKKPRIFPWWPTGD